MPDALNRIVEAAKAGKRCPTNDDIGSGMLRKLRAAGMIRVEVYTRNWRVVEILAGEHKGLRTAPCPAPGAKPYLVMEAGTPLHGGRHLGGVHGRPSAPRPLRSDELA